MSADPVAILRTVWPDTIPASEYERAVKIALEAVGYKPPPPKHRRMGAVIAGLLREYGEQQPEELARLAECSIGSVYNGLKACGAVRRDGDKGQEGGRPPVFYRLPEGGMDARAQK